MCKMFSLLVHMILIAVYKNTVQALQLPCAGCTLATCLKCYNTNLYDVFLCNLKKYDVFFYINLASSANIKHQIKNITSANTQCRTADPHKTLIQCWLNFGPPFTASASNQHWGNVLCLLGTLHLPLLITHMN